MAFSMFPVDQSVLSTLPMVHSVESDCSGLVLVVAADERFSRFVKQVTLAFLFLCFPVTYLLFLFESDLVSYRSYLFHIL